jgi:DNA-binding CsgD family transcriptional regulator
MAISRPSGRKLYSLLVAAIARNGSRENLLSGIQRRAAAVFACDPETEVGPTTAALRELFGLTPAEANLASVLMTGKSLDEARDELQISLNTAKTQLKAIFSKTSTSRQAELLRLLLLSVAHI